MSEVTEFVKILLLLGVAVSGYAEGDGAFYHQVSMRQVCERRVRMRWLPPAVGLRCSWPCLAAWGKYDPSKIGTSVLAYLPGGSFHE